MFKAVNSMFFKFLQMHTLLGFLFLLIFGPTPSRLWSAQATGPQWIPTSPRPWQDFSVQTTLLSDGKVLISGGDENYLTPVDRAEVYDPESDKWTVTGSLQQPRLGHTATLLPNGQVLVAGGTIEELSNVTTNSAELYDPTTGSWSFTGSMKWPRYDHSALLLANGTVLVTGGGMPPNDTAPDFEIYDPTTKTWSSVEHTESYSRFVTTTQLSTGKVLVVRGEGYSSTAFTKAQLFDPVLGTVRVTGGIQSKKRDLRAALLPDGRVLITSSNSTEIYDPTIDTWSATAGPGQSYALITLPNGRVLSAGWDSAKLFDAIDQEWMDTAKPTTGLINLNLLPNGKVLSVGREAALFDLGENGPGKLLTVSAASYRRTDLARGSIAAAFGQRLASGTLEATTLPLPAELGGTTVKIRDGSGIEHSAPLFFVSPTQINFQIPSEASPGIANVTVSAADGSSSSGALVISNVAPSLFTANADGRGIAAAVALRVKADGSRSYEPIFEFDPAQNRYTAVPIDLGAESDQVFLALFGTGIRNRGAQSSVIAYLGGVLSEVDFSGAHSTYAGADQVNVRIPRTLAGRGEVEVLFTVEAKFANPARIKIK